MGFFRDLLFLPPGASSVALWIDLLHIFVISVTMIGSFGVFFAGLWFMWHRPRSRHGDVTERVTAPVWFEALVIGGLLSLFILWWILGYIEYGNIRTPPERTIDIHVVAKQWMWEFADDTGHRSQSVLVVPRDRDVRLVMTSRDVIHSLFVPAFRLKQDVVPGRYTTLWFRATDTGTFDIYCAEYCGLNHSHMRAQIVALDPPDYERWLDGQVPEAVARTAGRAPGPDEPDMVETGRRLAVRFGCFSCHTETGERHIGPTWRGLYDSYVVLQSGERVLADDAYLTQSMMQPEAQVVAGFDPVMPSYHGVLSNADAAAIVEYIRSIAEPATEPPPVALPPVRALGEVTRDASMADLDAGTPAPFDSGMPNERQRRGRGGR